MIIYACNKNNVNVSLSIYMDHYKKDIIFFVTFAEREKQYKEYSFKTFRAAYNKYEHLINKYNLSS